MRLKNSQDNDGWRMQLCGQHGTNIMGWKSLVEGSDLLRKMTPIKAAKYDAKALEPPSAHERGEGVLWCAVGTVQAANQDQNGHKHVPHHKLPGWAVDFFGNNFINFGASSKPRNQFTYAFKTIFQIPFMFSFITLSHAAVTF